ncbi:MAG: hypothetical protein GYB66_09250 [Chloroflexi bacterium]|nr:hypothetical protein [Chloroflexota bacterium]
MIKSEYQLRSPVSSISDQQRYTIWASLPLMVIGLFICLYALVNAAWPPDYANALPDASVSHRDRLIGNDKPEDVESVERETGYQIRRFLDALAYFMLIQSVVAIVGLAWFTERALYLLLMVSGLYGVLYAAGLGNIIGPILFAGGFALVLWVAVLGWFATRDIVSLQDQIEA